MRELGYRPTMYARVYPDRRLLLAILTELGATPRKHARNIDDHGQGRRVDAGVNRPRDSKTA